MALTSNRRFVFNRHEIDALHIKSPRYNLYHWDFSILGATKIWPLNLDHLPNLNNSTCDWNLFDSSAATLLYQSARQWNSVPMHSTNNSVLFLLLASQ